VILWCDGTHDATENMRRDHELWQRAEGSAGPLEARMRLFRFQPHGITLGHAQRPEDELDLGRCRADGVAWAVRPTGGRAIFHAEEWTYSMVGRLDDPEWGGAQRQTFERIGALLRDSLAVLGIESELARASGGGTAPRGQGRAAAPCFATTTRLELIRGGRKLVGSAQRRGARAFIQQGSLLLSDGHLRLTDYLRIPEPSRADARVSLAAVSTHAGDRIVSSESLETWAEAIERVRAGSIHRVRGADSATLTA
jgi:lipoate-protein ligase A